MKVLASVSKSTKSGVSTWHFCQSGSTHFAINDDLKVIKCKTMDELRGMFKKYASYGYKTVQPVAKPVKVIKQTAKALATA